MKRVLIAIIFTFLSLVVYAQPSSEEIVSALLDSGCHGQIMLVYERDNTTIKTIYITSVVPLSQNYRKARAQKIAAKIAQVQAEQTLVKFLNSKVASSSTMGNKALDSVSQAEFETKYSENIASQSKGSISGVMNIASIPDRDGSYVAVYAWNNTANAALGNVSSSMKKTYNETTKE